MLYPSPSTTRAVIDLNGNWRFQVADATTRPDHPLPKPRWVAVPASINAQVLDRATRDHVGQFWYQTTLTIPTILSDRDLTLRFDAVAQAATVYLNGQAVGHHRGGYLPFEFPINDFVHPGDNDLKVLVDNRLDNTTLPTAELSSDGTQMTPRFDFTNFFGINRPVHRVATHEAGAREYFQRVIDYARQQDWQRRPITTVNIMVATPEKDRVGDLLDLLCLNRYYGWYVDLNALARARRDLKRELEAWHAKLPGKPIVMPEFGADTVPGVHSLTHAPYSEGHQEDYYQANFADFDQCPFVVGEQPWNFADFAVSPSLIRVNGQNLKGIFTRDLQPKGIARLLAARWQAK